MGDFDSMDDTVRSPRPSTAGSGGLGGGNWSEIPARVWIFAVIAAALLFALFGFWALYLFRGRLGAAGPTPTAIIWTPTASPPPTATPPPAGIESGNGDAGTGATPTPSEEIAVGTYVEVAGTGGYGLSLREGPGANYTRLSIAADGETFLVIDGPQMSAGSPWWEIRDPDDEAQTWWAVGNYLNPVARP